MATDESDDDLLRRARLQPEVFAELYERHARAVHRYLQRRTDRSAADDLLGEVFVAAIAARKRVVPHGSGSALPWLYGIAGNLLRAHVRRARRDSSGTSATDQQSLTTLRDPGVDWDSVDERLDAGALRGDLRVALAGLSANELEMLLLVAWEGLTPAEAGRALGITPVTARSRLLRARSRARTSLAIHQPEPTLKDGTPCR